MGKVSITGDHLTEPRKASKTRVRRECQHGQHTTNGQVIENAAACYGLYNLRKDALITRLFLMHSSDRVTTAENCYAAEQQREDYDDCRESALGISDSRLSKRTDSVANRLHAGHCRATACKRAKQQPKAASTHRCRGEHWRSNYRPGVTVLNCFDYPPAKHE